MMTTESSEYYVAVFPSGTFDRFEGPFNTEEAAFSLQGKVFQDADSEQSLHNIVYCFIVPTEKKRYLRWYNDESSDLDMEWETLLDHLAEEKA